MKLKLTQEQLKVLYPAIDCVWQQIGSDAYALEAEMGERLTNKGAIELCIDADRLSEFDKRYGPPADKLLDELLDKNSYTAVLNALSREIELV